MPRIDRIVAPIDVKMAGRGALTPVARNLEARRLLQKNIVAWRRQAAQPTSFDRALIRVNFSGVILEHHDLTYLVPTTMNECRELMG